MAKGNSKALERSRQVKSVMTVVSNPPLNAEQMLTIASKTPAEHIYTRPAKGGGVWRYVTGSYIKDQLNRIFGYMWDFTIKEHGTQGDTIWVLGRLTVKNGKGLEISKEQFGRADVKYKKGTKDFMDFGNDLKAAATDALKKCASEFGIAGDIYRATEFQEISIPDPDAESKEEIDRNIIKIKTLIKSAKEIETLADLGIKLNESKKYSKAQKEELLKLINEKQKELQ